MQTSKDGNMFYSNTMNPLNGNNSVLQSNHQLFKKAQESIRQQSLNIGMSTTKTATESKAANTVLGYKVDSNGYFMSDFNKAAGIPDDFKIHSSTMESLVRIQTQDKENAFLFKTYFKSIDIAATAGNAYRMLTQILGKETLEQEGSFSKEQLATLPQGFEYDAVSLEVTKVYDGILDTAVAMDRFNYTNNENKNISTVFFNESMSAFTRDKTYLPSTNILDNLDGGKETNIRWGLSADKYIDSDGSITKGGLLVAFMNQHQEVVEGESTIFGKVSGADHNINQNQRQELQMMMFSDVLKDGEFNLKAAEITDIAEFRQWYADYATRQKRKFAEEAEQRREEQQQWETDWKKLLESLDENFKSILRMLTEKATKAKREEQRASKYNLAKEQLELLQNQSQKSLDSFMQFYQSLQTQWNQNKDSIKLPNLDRDLVQRSLSVLAGENDMNDTQSYSGFKKKDGIFSIEA